MRRVIVALLAVLLLIGFATKSTADTSLTGAVGAAYFQRTESTDLHNLAHRRAVEVSTNWSHDGRRADTWEVLAYNQWHEDPIASAIRQWQGSPTHDVILENRSLTQIGCAEYVSPDQTHWFACVLLPAAEPVEVVSSPKPVPVGSSPTSGATTDPVPPPRTEPAPVLVLPNTALGQ